MSRSAFVVALSLAAACSKKPDADKQEPAPAVQPAPAPSPTAPAPDPAPRTPTYEAVDVDVLVDGTGRTYERLAASGEHVYWLEGTIDGMLEAYVYHRAGSADAVETKARGQGLAVDGEYVYYIDENVGERGALVRRRHAGGDPEKLSDLQSHHLAVDGGTVFGFEYTTPPGKGGKKVDKTVVWKVVPGGAAGTVLEVATPTRGLAVGGGRLYRQLEDTIVSTSYDGKDERVYNARTASIHADATHLYFALSGGGTGYIPHAGGLEVFSNDYGVVGLDDKHVYAIGFTAPGSKDAKLVAIDKATKAVTDVWTPPAGQYPRAVVRAGDELVVQLIPGRIVRLVPR